MNSAPSSLSCPPRYATPRRPDRASHGPQAAQIAEILGLRLMPWQRLVLDTALEVNPDTGRLVYREVRLTVPRQQGKSTLLLVLKAHRCLAMGPNQRVVATAQTAQDARRRWEDDYLPRLTQSKLAPLMQIRRANGSEAIRWQNGSLWSLMAPTETSGHGATIDLAVLDEAFAQVDNRVEQAVKPAMMTRPEPQFWIVSTAGTNESLYLNEKVAEGRERAELGVTDGGVCYFEWSADESLDPLDPETWQTCMPALGHTVPLEAIAADFQSMPLAEARRAYLNQTRNTLAAEPWQVITEDQWARCADARSEPVSKFSFAVDVAPDRSSAAVGGAGWREDGRVHVELGECGAGVAWVVDWLVSRHHRWSDSPVTIDSGSAAGSLISELEAKGIPVRVIGARQHVQACGQFFDRVVGGQLHHRGTQPELASALAGAKRRTLGESWAWSRRDASVDVTPLVAVTLATGALLSAESQSSVDVVPSIFSLHDL